MTLLDGKICLFLEMHFTLHEKYIYKIGSGGDISVFSYFMPQILTITILN